MRINRPIATKFLTINSTIGTIFRLDNGLMISRLKRIHLRRLNRKRNRPTKSRHAAALMCMATVRSYKSSTHMNKQTTSFLNLRHLSRHNLNVTNQQLNFVTIQFSITYLSLLTSTRQQRKSIKFKNITLNNLNIHLTNNDDLIQTDPDTKDNNLKLTPLPHNLRGTKRFSSNTEHLRRNLTLNKTNQHERTRDNNKTNNIDRLTNRHTLPSRHMRTRLISQRFKNRLIQIIRTQTHQTGALINFLHTDNFNNMLLKLNKRRLITRVMKSNITNNNSNLLQRHRQVNSRVNSMTILMRTLNHTRRNTDARTRTVTNNLLRNQNNRQQLQTTTMQLNFRQRRDRVNNLRHQDRNNNADLVGLTGIHHRPIQNRLAINARVLKTNRSLTTRHSRTNKRFTALPRHIEHKRHNSSVPMQHTPRHRAFTLTFRSRSNNRKLRTTNKRTQSRLTPRRQQRLVTMRAIRGATDLLDISRVTISVTHFTRQNISNILNSLIRRRTLSQRLKFRNLRRIPHSNLTLTVLVDHRVRFINILRNQFRFTSHALLVTIRSMMKLRPIISIRTRLTRLNLIYR